MKLSLVVLTYNRSDAALAVLRALASQCGPQEEVIVADDGSRAAEVDRLLSQAPSFAGRALHVWHPDRGFTAAEARNRAARLAHGDYLVFLDGDCVPGPRFVQQHRRLAERGCFVNGSRVLLSARLTQELLASPADFSRRSASFWWSAWRRGDLNKPTHLLSWPASWRPRHPRFQWRGIRSCNFAVWQDDFIAVNGFDQVFEGWGHEDADLVLRLHHQGLRRKNGFWATEVFHLWHPEHARDRESLNRARVLERQAQGTVRASSGLAELVDGPDVRLTPLGPQ